MQNSKFVQLLSSLDKSEFRLLYKYLRSPFFNYSTAVLSLYELLRKYYPDFNHQALDRRQVYRELFPGMDYDDKRMRNLLHECSAHLEQFLIQLQLRSDELTGKQLLLRALAGRGAYGAFTKKNQSLTRKIADRPYRDIATYLQLLSLQEQYYFHPATDKLADGAGLLQQISEYLDHYFMGAKLRLANELATRYNIVSENIPIRWVDEVLTLLDQEASPSVLLSLYALSYRLHQTGNESLFSELKARFYREREQLSVDDQQVILLQLLNFAIRTGNKGQATFLREAFDLYAFGLDSGLLFEHGKLTDSTFLNVVLLGGKIGKLEEVRHFITKYADYLEDSVREDAVTLARANVLYLQGRFEAVDQLIGNTRFQSPFYQLRSRLILLRSLYEFFLSDDTYFELLQARMEAFEKWLRRNKQISSVHRRAHLSFVQLLRQVAQLRTGPAGPAEKDSLSDRIRQSEELPNKEWLLTQVEA